MRNLKIWAIALVVFTLVVGCRSAASSRPAVMYRGDAQRSGAFDTKGIRQLSGTLWQFKTGGPVWSSPVVANGVVYFGSDDDFFYAVDARAGQEQWRFETGDDVRSSPAIADGIVYFRSYDHYLYAVDARSGQLVWKANLLDISLDEGEALPREQYDDFISSPLVANGTVYAGGYLSIFALDARTGQEQWRFAGPYALRATPAIFGDTIYFGGFNDLYAVDARTGQERWRFKAQGDLAYAPAVSDDGVVYFGSKDAHLYAVDGRSGELKWKMNPTNGTSWVSSSPALFNGMVYAGTSMAASLHAVRMDTGEQAWKFMTGGWVWSSPAVADGVAYIGSRDKHLYAVDAQTGQELWNFETGGSVYSSPAVADGVVYCGSLDGSVYALH